MMPLSLRPVEVVHVRLSVFLPSTMPSKPTEFDPEAVDLLIAADGAVALNMLANTALLGLNAWKLFVPTISRNEW